MIRLIQKLGSLPVLLAMLIGGLAVILYAGLTPKGFINQNRIEWVEEGAGLRFQGRGLAYTEPVLSPYQFSQEAGMTIEFALRFERQKGEKFRIIAVFFGEEEPFQLCIGQWQNEILVFQGDDYGLQNKTPFVSHRFLQLVGEREAFLTIVGKKDGTSLYLDGTEVLHRKGMQLKLPDREDGVRLILGNSAAGLRPWTGELGGMAVYARALEKEEVGRHASLFREGKDFSAFAPERPHLLLPLDQEGGRTASDSAPFHTDLKFPRGKTFVVTSHFLADLDGWTVDLGLWDDISLNFLGFTPLGGVLVLLFLRRLRSTAAFLLTVGCGFALSFGIETYQAWMPSRTSSLLDLVLNTGGTALGAIGLRVFLGWFGQPAALQESGTGGEAPPAEAEGGAAPEVEPAKS